MLVPPLLPPPFGKNFSNDGVGMTIPKNGLEDRELVWLEEIELGRCVLPLLSLLLVPTLLSPPHVGLVRFVGVGTLGGSPRMYDIYVAIYVLLLSLLQT